MKSSWDYVDELLDEEEMLEGHSDTDTTLELAQQPMIGVLSPNGEEAKLVAPIIELLPNGIVISFDKEKRIYMSYISAVLLSKTISEASYDALTGSLGNRSDD